MNQSADDNKKIGNGWHLVALMLFMASAIMFFGMAVELSLGRAKNPNAWAIPVCVFPFVIMFFILINKAKTAGKFDIDPQSIPNSILFFPAQALCLAVIKWSGMLGPKTTQPMFGFLAVCAVALLFSPYINKIMSHWLGVPNVLSKSYQANRSVE